MTDPATDPTTDPGTDLETDPGTGSVSNEPIARSSANGTARQTQALPSRLTVDNADAVLQRLLSDRATEIDLSAVEYCDSAGVAALIEAKAVRCRAHAASDDAGLGAAVGGDCTAHDRAHGGFIYRHPGSQLIDLARFLKVETLLFGDGIARL